MTNRAAPGDVAVEAREVAFSYGERRALDGVGFTVPPGGVHGFLGPNGSGKSTLFKLLATILPLKHGTVTLLGLDLATQFAEVRKRIGVVFQSPALDKKLSIRQNLRYGGHLQGLRGPALEKRIDEMLEIGKLKDRAKDAVEHLSGGLRRRVEIAKGLLHRPDVVLLDEPSTGLDPTARMDLWGFLREQSGLTVLFTTHLMEEADEADRLTILDDGRVVADGSPDELRRTVGGEVLELTTGDPEALARDVEGIDGAEARVVGHVVRIEHPEAHRLVPEIVSRFGERVERLTLGQPTLEDVFVDMTGHRLEDR